MKKHQLLCLFFAFSLAQSLFCQIVGGQKNGQAGPSEVKASEVGAGGFSGNVNLFSGTYNASYPLGTVSTPTGLSFTATLSYGSTYSTGDNLPHTSGIPYGEGWNVDIPSISVSSEDFNKFTLWEEYNIQQGIQDPETGAYTKIFSLPEAMDEGSIYWFSPTLNLPGVASGRMVYKYFKNGEHHFVLHAFDRYVEARFNGQKWEVILDDGTIYSLNPAVVTYRTPSNQRVQGGAFEGEPDEECLPSHGGGALSNLVLPKPEVLTWYCTSITNRNIVGEIHFRYQTFGAFDYNKILTTQDVMWENISKNWLGSQNSPIERKPQVTYKDIILTEIESGYERLKLDYQSIPVAGGDKLLDLSDPEVERLDSLYSYKAVYTAEGNNGFNNWFRYKHPKRIPVSSFNPSSTNPYKHSQSYPFYERESVVQSNFNHGYLESPRLSEGAFDLISGDMYEIRTKIGGCTSDSPTDGCMFDINLSTGDYFPGLNPSAPPSGPGIVPALEHDYRNRESVFSTFNQAIKWFTHGVSNPGDGLTTSNYFVMPTLPAEYQGFHIQVGPANSDNDFSMEPIDIVPSCSNSSNGFTPATHKSYFKEDCDEAIAQQQGSQSFIPNCLNLRSGDNIPNNFGIGIPWFMLHEFYSSCNWNGNYSIIPSNSCYPTGPYMDFWWNDNSISGYTYPNEPTMTGTNYMLDEVQLIRYSKNPYMLKSAKKQIFNAGMTALNNPDDVWHTVSHAEFEHEIQLARRWSTKLHENGATILYEEDGFRNVILLKGVTQLPYNEDGLGDNIPLKTKFFYESKDENFFGPVPVSIQWQHARRRPLATDT